MADPQGYGISSIYKLLAGWEQNSVTGPPGIGGGGAPPAGMAPPGGATNNYASTALAPEEPTPEVYLGTTKYETEQDTPRGYGSQTDTKKADHTDHPDALLRAFQKASPEEQRNMALLLSMGGFAGSGSLEDRIEKAADMTLGDTIEAYANLLSEATTAFSLDGRKITPEQILKRAIAYRLPSGTSWDGDFDSLDGALADAGILKPDVVEKKDKPFSGTKSITTESVNRSIMDPADAKALTRAMLQRELGRDPTEGEFEDFIGAIQYAQKVNPDRSTNVQSSTYKRGELVNQTSNTTTHQGIGAEGVQDIALQKSRSNPGWAEWQAVGTYAPALFEALGSTVPGR